MKNNEEHKKVVTEKIDIPITIPEKFELKNPKIELIIGLICSVFFLTLGVFFIYLSVRDSDGWLFIIGYSSIWLFFVGLGIYLTLNSYFSRLCVHGNSVAYTTWNGKQVKFELSDVIYVKVSKNHINLINQENKVICKLQNNMSNLNIFIATLQHEGIEFSF